MQGTTRVESVNISQNMQDVSPDRVFDFEAASRRAPSPEEAQALQALREKLQAEIQVCTSLREQSQPSRLFPSASMQCAKSHRFCEEVYTFHSQVIADQLVTRTLVIQELTNQKGKAVICESDVPGTLIVKFTPASRQEVPASASTEDMTPNGLTAQGQLSLRVDTTYPKSTPAYFRLVTPDQTLQEQMQVLYSSQSRCCASFESTSPRS